MKKMKASTRNLGIAVVVVLLLGFVIAYQKQRIVSVFSPGDTIAASFSRQFKLQPFLSAVKLAGVRVGEVTDIEESDAGATVTMRIDKGVRAKLGGQPSASIRPTLVVGGVYYVDLKPGGTGGQFDGRIPFERTTIPVELDGVLSAINTDAQKGMRGFMRNFDQTLKQGGRDSIRRFLHETPPSLRPISEVLASVRGTDPSQDLTRMVQGFEGFAATFNRNQDQFGHILDSLATSTGAFYAERAPLAATFVTLPESLVAARDGLTDLQGSLDRLTETAPRFRDSAQELDPMLKDLAPVVSRARPAVSDLKVALEDGQPLIEKLVPVARRGDEMFSDIKGPVLDRVNGPIKDAVLNPWHGSGVYANGGNDHKMYEEIAYLTYVLDDAFSWHDANGGFGRLEAGGGGNTVTGGSQFPRPLEQQLESFGMQKPNGPQDSDPKKDKGYSGLYENRKPINEGVPNLPPLGPVPAPGANPLMGGAK